VGPPDDRVTDDPASADRPADPGRAGAGGAGAVVDGAGGERGSPGTDGPPLLDVGRVARSHGLRGEVVVEPWSDLPERLAPGSVLQTDRGPLTVVASRPHQGRMLVVFAGIEDRPAADGLRGRVLRAPAVDRPDTWWVHELVGAELFDTAGRRLGLVVAVEANPASDLLVLEGGALVPLRFVVDRVPGVRLTAEVPEGLVE
jgi:16S rRNA processing protein RimM